MNAAKYHYRHESGAISYITNSALSINEAGGPINFHINWGSRPGIYLYLFGLRLYWFKKQKDDVVYNISPPNVVDGDDPAWGQYLHQNRMGKKPVR